MIDSSIFSYLLGHKTWITFQIKVSDPLQPFYDFFIKFLFDDYLGLEIYLDDVLSSNI